MLKNRSRSRSGEVEFFAWCKTLRLNSIQLNSLLKNSSDETNGTEGSEGRALFFRRLFTED
jgi:hypothetical protein